MSGRKDDNGLNDKQRKFCAEYIVDFNATKAALRAGYSPSTADFYGHRLLKNQNTQHYIEKITAERSKRLEVSQDRVILEIARLALSDPRNIFSEDGAIKPIKDWTEDSARSVSSIKVLELKDANGNLIGFTKEVKFWDKNASLDKLMRHIGGYKVDNEQKSPLENLSPEALLLIKERLLNAKQQS